MRGLDAARPLLVATHNAGKAREIADLLKAYGIKTVSAAERNIPEPEETGKTFLDNAALKARAGAAASGMTALADDSGLVVPALGGEPGIYSARWAGEKRDFQRAMRKVEEALCALRSDDPALRRASFVCVLALAWPDGHVESFEGEVSGRLVWPPRGTRGFGYDPIFVPEGRAETFGEMDPAEKHAISHRARAFAKLTAVLAG